jgi:L-2,4-diaminobutyrate decarboxylase
MPFDPLAAIEQDARPEAAACVIGLATDLLAASAAGSGPVSPATPPAALAARFDEPMPVEGRALEEVLERVRRDVLDESIALSHPMYLGHQVSAPLPAAIWTESVTGALNNSLAVREMSPAGTIVEHRVIRWMCELAGFGPGAGGTFTSGGTEATFSALLAARAALRPDAWEAGLGEPPVLVCGEHAHYAVARAAGTLGLGIRNVVKVRSTDYRMEPAALRESLDRIVREGREVMAVVATAGSTATGSFDDLEAIGALCEERGIWLHVDAAHGASALLSDEHRHRLAGIARARSIAWDPHKMMLVPVSAGMVLVRRERDLDAAFAQQAPYLFHGGDERHRDQGVRSFQCSRRFDALKVWVALQRYGARGIAELHDRLCRRARELYDLTLRHPGFEPVHEPESNILCFRFVADGLDAAATDEVNRSLRSRYNAGGEGWITLTVLDARPVLRVTVMNPRTEPSHLGRLLDGLAATGAKIVAQLRETQ